jgi:hypothetical protein
MKAIHKAVDECMNFLGLVPEKVETNVGGLWFSDKNTGKKYFILIDECAEGI